jgi:hypothetical protein
VQEAGSSSALLHQSATGQQIVGLLQPATFFTPAFDQSSTSQEQISAPQLPTSVPSAADQLSTGQPHNITEPPQPILISSQDEASSSGTATSSVLSDPPDQSFTGHQPDDARVLPQAQNPSFDHESSTSHNLDVSRSPRPSTPPSRHPTHALTLLPSSPDLDSNQLPTSQRPNLLSNTQEILESPEQSPLISTIDQNRVATSRQPVAPRSIYDPPESSSEPEISPEPEPVPKSDTDKNQTATSHQLVPSRRSRAMSKGTIALRRSKRVK